jgi:cytochrome c553
MVGLAVVAGPGQVAGGDPPATASDPLFSPAQLDHFERKIRPLLAAHCYECHAGQAHEGNLRVDSRAALIVGGDTGPAIDLTQPAASLLLDAVQYGDLYQMPPSGQLSAAEIQLLAAWLAEGAPWPAEHLPASAAQPPPFDLQARKAAHWAWRPIAAPQILARSDGAALAPIDALLMDQLDGAELPRAPQAAPTERLRRAAFDLTGLPPEAVDVAAIQADASPAAWERTVDRLLASPRFGERWARHWLDVVRYAETLGHESDFPLTSAWRYRDYVIRAFNDDLPYDQFVYEHVAGDLIDPPRRHPTEGFDESILATAFWYLGEAIHAPVDSRADQATRLENQVDVLSKAFLGLTVACARCHDHKFDAISTKDYYALAGIAASSHQQVAYLDPHGEYAAAFSQLQDLHAQACEAIATATPASEIDAEPAGAQPSAASGLAPGELLFESFSAGLSDWYRSGWAFGTDATQLGDWRPTADGPRALAAGLAHSGRFADRLPGVLRSRTFTIERPYIHYRVAGRTAKVRLIVDGYALDPFTPQLFEGFTFEAADEAFQWRSQDASRYLGHRAHIELVDSGEGYLAVDEIRFSDAEQPPSAPATPQPAADAIAASPTIDAITRAIAAIDAALPEPIQAVAIGEGSGEDLRVHIRGNYKTLGPVAPRGLLEGLDDGGPRPSSPHSGRRELAEALVAADNPFLARVMVNRIWLHLFGRGIVPTADNFGALGEPPTHPELLDYLAARFIEQNWSVKSLIREIMLSEAYQLSSVGHSAAEALDPTNRRYHRANVRRLEGEAIRDALLAVSGSLDVTPFGPPVPIHLTPFMDGRGRPATSGPLDGAGRRSVYLEVRRNFLAPFLLAFDMPTPATCVGQRHSSNVPAQALALLNDPFVYEQCERWSARALAASATNEDRVNQLYVAAFSRPASDEEIAAALEFIRQQSAALHVPADDPQLWTDLCHVLVNLKEFIYLK